MADDRKVENEDKQEVKKEVLSAPKMAYQLIGSLLIWGVVLYLPISLVEVLATSWMKSVWLRFPCMAVLEGIAVICLWKLSNIRVFKKRTIRPNKVNALMKYLIVVTIIMTVLFGLSDIRGVKKEYMKPQKRSLGQQTFMSRCYRLVYRRGESRIRANEEGVCGQSRAPGGYTLHCLLNCHPTG